ncbi:MAG: N-6 DNA methylase [Bacteroidia bacterium]|nr:N-6 DNA methylase [Bacteroidia bacterium]
MDIETKESALKRITELVETFDEHYETYHRINYDEAKTRGTFIEEFFKAFGWDVHNKEGVDESYRDVIPEDKIKIEGRTKAPDYCFTIRGQKKFFVEAKKPSVKIKTDNAAVFQLRRYGYHKKLSISIITNFEEFAVYDCTKKPFLYDKTSVGRIRYIFYKDYLKEFDFLWNTFSKESVLKGRYDKFVKSDTEKRGTSTIDADFLVSLNEWRKYLAKSIAWNNRRLTQEEVQYAVQQTIDRIIFMIFCEYKNIEPFGNLKHATEKGNLYKNLFELFSHADQKYNSGLFDFYKDRISEKLTIDNKVIKNIILDLYLPNSEYDFGILPVEVLGNAYEQFLGKIIRITPGHIVKIEDKPEVKKVGGVYYTPEYIVEYIVRNTVGKIIKGKNPAQISKIKIVDPACGSGSFLICAYQYLLNYHSDYYIKNRFQEKRIKSNPLTPEGRLTTEIKREILLNNIFGVDIDQQAVEVTKLSLLLKAMEGETEITIKRQLQLIHQRVLPNIDGNIKCGNSLIGYDFNGDFLELDKEERKNVEKKLKFFNWEAAFPEVFKQGGFDVVIGNPPYRTLLLGKKQKSEDNIVVNYYQAKFPNSFEYKVNLFALFMEESTALMKKGGLFSFIIPNTFFTAYSFKNLRKFLLKSGCLKIVYDLRYKVFRNAEIGGSGIFVFSKGDKSKIFFQLTANTESEFNSLKIQKVKSCDLLSNVDYLLTSENEVNAILKKIKRVKTIELGNITKIYQGIITGNNDKFLSTNPLNSKWQKILRGKDINRYYLKWDGIYVYYYPKELWSNTDLGMFNVKEKIISRQTSDRLIATIDTQKYFTLDSTHVIHLLNNSFSLKYLLAIFNSKLLNFIYQNKVKESGRVFAQVKVVNLKPLPIRVIDFNSKSEKFLHNEIVKHVDNLLQLNEEIRKTKIPAQHEQIQNRISYCENRIDELVFDLYRLSKKDIETIKNNLHG